jgi:hypothetical protein
MHRIAVTSSVLRILPLFLLGCALQSAESVDGVEGADGGEAGMGGSAGQGATGGVIASLGGRGGQGGLAGAAGGQGGLAGGAGGQAGTAAGGQGGTAGVGGGGGQSGGASGGRGGSAPDGGAAGGGGSRDASPDRRVVDLAPPPDTAECPGAQQKCGGGCVDLRTSAMHCGACDKPCGAGPCQGGVCRCTNGTRDGDETDVDCGGGCGACGFARRCAAAKDCQAGLACLSGRCLPTAGIGAWYPLDAPGPLVPDVGPHGNNGTGVGTKAAPGKVGGAIQFDNNACVRVPNAPSLGFAGGTGLTMMAWINVTGACTSDRGIILNKESSYEMGIHCGNQNLQSAIFTSTTSWQWLGAHRIAANTWTHVAVTWDGQTVRHYVDGAEVETRMLRGMLLDRMTGFGVGCRRVTATGLMGGESQLNGAIDEAAVYGRPWTAKELADYVAATR